MDIHTYTLGSIRKVPVGFAFLVHDMDLNGGNKNRVLILVLLGGIKIVCQCLFYFYSATKQAECFEDIFCFAVSKGSTQHGKENQCFRIV